MATKDKYDRQLRLWGKHGQECLHNSHVLLIQASSVGTEILKNIVLPGLKAFTILDDQLVSEADVVSNFFVLHSSIGKCRAEVACELVRELNPDTTGFADTRCIEDVILKDISYLSQFSLVVATNNIGTMLSPLSSYCSTHKIPLVIAQSCGYLGYLRLQYSRHEIIESRPMNDIWDLRLVSPFPALLDFVNSIELSKDNINELPYIVLLLKMSTLWKEQNEGNLPTTYVDKDNFRKDIQKIYSMWAPEMQLGGIHLGENYNECMTFFYQCFRDVELPDDVLAIVEENRLFSLRDLNSNFRLLVRCLSMFMERFNNQIPLAGTLPDMACSTQWYLQLARVYQDKAAEDRKNMRNLLCEIEKSLGREESQISDDLLDLFCKNISNIRCLSTRCWTQEVLEGPIHPDDLCDEVAEDPPQSPFLWYFAIRAGQAFYDKHNRWPGSPCDASVEEIERDIDEVWQLIRSSVFSGGEKEFESWHEKLVQSIIGNAECHDSDDIDGNSAQHVRNQEVLTRDHAREIVRFGGCEIHSISALMGGIAGQEITKLLTHQFVPINHTYIYNGIAGWGSTYEF